jgi:hypothetical protein
LRGRAIAGGLRCKVTYMCSCGRVKTGDGEGRFARRREVGLALLMCRGSEKWYAARFREEKEEK